MECSCLWEFKSDTNLLDTQTTSTGQAVSLIIKISWRSIYILYAATICVKLQHNAGWLYPFIFKLTVSNGFSIISTVSLKKSHIAIPMVSCGIQCLVQGGVGCWNVYASHFTRVLCHFRAEEGSESCLTVLIVLLFTIWIVYVMCRWYSFLITMSWLSSVTITQYIV